MNRFAFLFLGILGAMAFSWTGVVLVNQLSYGGLTPHLDDTDGVAYPRMLPGLAAQGQRVYQDLGCVACHTQQVRRDADVKRGWGERPSVARDYLPDHVVLLGQRRVGPDLRNVGARRSEAEWHYRHLYNPQLTTPGSLMPSYRFLFETRQIVGEPSAKAIQHLLPSEAQPAPGYEIVPTRRAESLVAYLLNLQDTYAFPETRNVYTAPEKNAEKQEGNHQ